MFKRVTRIAVIVYGIVAASAVSAQTIVVEDGDKIEADISLQYPTRITLKHDDGNQLIFNSIEGASPQVEATVDDKGDIYLSVIEGAPGQKVSGFLTTQAGNTYLVRLKIDNGDADQIEIVNRKAREKAELAKSKQSAEHGTASSLTTVKWERGAQYQQNIAAIMRTLYFGAQPEGFVKQKSKTLPAVPDVSLKAVETYAARNAEAMILEAYNLKDYTINPANQKDDYKPYIAISFLSDSVAPGVSTQVFLIRKRTGRR